MAKIKVTQSENETVPVEVIATSIRAIAAGMKKLRAGPLNDKAVILLIQHAAGGVHNGAKLTQYEIKSVLDAIEDLEKTYLKKKSAH